MPAELLQAIEPKEGGFYVDATLGGGGHMQQLLDSLKSVTILAFDLNLAAIERVSQSLVRQGFSLTASGNVKEFEKENQKIYLVHDNFSTLKKYTDKIGKPVDSIYADLGFSTDELSETAGLSFEKESELLGMQFDNTAKPVYELIASMSAAEIAKILMDYADLTFAQANEAATAIVLAKPKTVGELNNALSEVLSRYLRERSLLARIYQALRIAVNDEYESLKKLVQASKTVLKDWGLLVVITFHSGEENTLLIAANEFEQIGEFKRPSVIELRKNLRARSAKLFVFKKK